MRLRHLVVTVALAAIAVVLALTLVWVLLREPQPAAAPLVPAASSTAPSYNPDAHDAGTENDNAPAETQEDAWGPVVDSFARNFTNTAGGKNAWRQRLIGTAAQPMVTTDVAEQLATVDIRNVPDGHYQARELVTSGAYEVGVKVTYREGWAQVLYLVTDGTYWQIYAYDEWEA